MPLDRRVWLECQALTAAGYDVSVICPKGPGDPTRQVFDDIHIYKYRPAPQASGVAGFVVEFVYSWVRTALLSQVAWRHRPFDILQACNPPDTYWALALLWKLRRVRFVYDQHDLNPELFISRFGHPSGGPSKTQYEGLLWLERMTYRLADRVISTNESYRAIAMRRGKRDGRDVTVVRSGPDTTRMRPVVPDPSVRRGARYLLVYLGIMGPQDGVDLLVEVMEELVHHRGRDDIHLALLGFGDCLDDLRVQTRELGLDSHVTFTDRADPQVIARYLSSADLGMCPDPKTPLNDVSTMNKTMEYMAYCLPPISFDLKETRVSAGETAFFVPTGDIAAFADAVERLLGDDELRVRMGLAARDRVASELDWLPQARRYVDVFDDLSEALGFEAHQEPAASESANPQGDEGAEYVDLVDVARLTEFVRARGLPNA